MVAPAPVNPQIEKRTDGSSAVVSGGAQTTSRFLRSYGFHVLAILLCIALAFL
jgi:hypothetical protein